MKYSIVSIKLKICFDIIYVTTKHLFERKFDDIGGQGIALWWKILFSPLLSLCKPYEIILKFFTKKHLFERKFDDIGGQGIALWWKILFSPLLSLCKPYEIIFYWT